MIIGYFVIHFIPPVHVRVFVGIGVVFECVQFVGLIACIPVSYTHLDVYKRQEVTEPKDLRSPAVSLKDINLRINRQFKKDIESELVLQRYHSPFRVKNPCINRQDYASLVGKTKTQACLLYTSRCV